MAAKDKEEILTPDELVRFMKAYGLGKKDLAKLLDVTVPAVDHWLRARREITGPVVRLIRIFDKYNAIIPEYKV